ncbi:MAG: YebC/PmpR family DNA-binding transcriptional regulator [Gemmatimonadetes bacterium]|nr:YebC/PmpR family DNA-binding transcriptional regulator [Gemmatimonadota bacterium]
MSGHSKWSTIKRKKGVADAQRGRIFTRLIKEITVAARNGGGDIDGNPRLRTAVTNARAENMPADNIKKAIQRGTGELPGVTYEEMAYEGYGPGGVAILVTCLTDNKNRTVADVRHLFSKHGGNLGAANSVAWMFDRKGQITVDADEHEEESLLLEAAEAGADDVLREEDELKVLTSFQAFQPVQQALQARGIEFKSAELVMVPKSTVAVEEREAERLLKLLEALEDHDDVQSVAANFDIDEAVLSRAS